MRAAKSPPTRTVVDPTAIMSGGPVQTHMSVTRACGIEAVSTVNSPNTIGPPTCGTTPVTIGHTCWSVIRAAGGIAHLRYCVCHASCSVAQINADHFGKKGESLASVDLDQATL